MPGNEVGDRVHNFFAQDNLYQGQHHLQVVDGNWPVLNNNLRVGSHTQFGVPSSSPKNYNLQQSDGEKGHTSHSLPAPHGLIYTQSTLRPEFARNQSQGQQPNLNGYIYGNHIFQKRQDETNFLGVDTEADRHNLNPTALSICESQRGSGPDYQTNTSIRLETSESPVSFDFFGGQQQMNHQQLGMLLSLSHQQSDFNEMQQLPQQVMFRKMQELQKLQQFRQLDAKQQNSMNQFSTSSAKQASGSHSPALINGTPISDASNYPWTSELTAGDTNWMQRGSPAGQGSSGGLVFSPDQAQAPRVMGLVAQEVDKSLYGVPVASSRSSPTQYPVMATDKPSMQQMSTLSNNFPSNQYAVLPDQVSMQDGSLNSRHGFQRENLFGHASGQFLSSGINMGNLQQMNSLQRNAPMQESQGRQELVGPSETLQRKTEMQVTSQNAVSLDPAEEKILFGSDDNLWDAFGRSSNVTGGRSSNMLGSWSALMQSAVAETSSSDIGIQGEWSDLGFQHTGVVARNNRSSTYDDGGKQQTKFSNDNPQAASAIGSGSFSLSDSTNMNNNYHGVMGFQQLGKKFSYEHGESLQTNSSQNPNQQSSEGGSKWLNRGPQKSVTEVSQIYGNASHSLDAEMNAKSVVGLWKPQYSGPSHPSNKPNGSNVIESASPSEDVAFKIHENENSEQHTQSNIRKSALQGEVGCGGGDIWKVNSFPSSTFELGPVKSYVGSPQVNGEGFSSNNAALIPNSSNTKADHETGQFLSNSHQLSYLTNADSLVKSTGSEDLGKLQHLLNNRNQVLDSSLHTSDKEQVKIHDMENYHKKNSNDSYRYNSSPSSAGGLRESVLADGSDSQTLPGGKQKSSNQIGRKTSGPRKLQFHPMRHLDHAEPSHGTRHATHSHSLSLQNSGGFIRRDREQFGQSKFPGQDPKSSMVTVKEQLPDLQGDTKGFNEAPSRGILSGYAPNASASFDRSGDLYAPNNDSQSSQNMLELLQKVDKSREHGTRMHVSSSEHNPSSEIPESEKSDVSVGRVQRTQSSSSQGFGLQLAPPNQRLPAPNHSLSFQSSVQTHDSVSSLLTTPEIGDKSRTKLAFTSSVQSLLPPNETSQGQLKSNRFNIPGQSGSEASLYKMPGNFSSAFNSGFPYARSQIQNQYQVGASGNVWTNHSIDSSDRNASHSKQTDDSCSRPLTGQSADALPDVADSIQYSRPVSSGNESHSTRTNHPHERVSTPQISVGKAVTTLPPFTASGISQHSAFPMLSPNTWINPSAQQHSLGAQSRKISSKLYQPDESKNAESGSRAFFVPQNLGDPDAGEGEDVPPGFGTSSVNSHLVHGEEQPTMRSPGQQASSGNIDMAQKMNESQWKEPTIKHVSDATSANPALTQRDIETFGHSLKPNSFGHENYSLLDQMNAETDPSNRDVKRLKGPEGGLVDQQVAHMSGQSNECNTMVGDSLVPRATIPSGDYKMLSFSGLADNFERNASSQLGNVPSQDMHALDWNNSQNNTRNDNSVRIENSRISPQMAPSWFNQYGTFKNGKMLPMYDARKSSNLKTVEQPFTLGKSSMRKSIEQVNAVVDTNQVGNTQQTSIPASVGIEQFSLPRSLPPDASDQSLLVLRPKKRKTAASGLNPWHKEVSKGSPILQTSSTADLDWARAAKRLTEKGEDDAEMIEDGQSLLRPKRRLILTTQLMQQLLPPPPAAILSTDASSNYESVAYFVARLALGDGCSLVTRSRSASNMPCDDTSLLSDKCRVSERIDDQYLLKVMEDFMGRARNLENDFLRLDQKASVLDLRVECQDLEKFSVINRFAKFHGRGQAEMAEASSLANAAANAQQHCPQRYVTALPLPRNLPDWVQCLSL